MRQKPLFWIGCFLGILVLFWVMIVLRDNKADMEILGKISKIPHYDKIGHFFMMGGLSFCAVSAAKCFRPNSGPSLTFKVLGTLILLSGAEELLQAYAPSRTLSFTDFSASVVGILFFGWLAHRRDAKRSTPPPSDPPS